MKILGDGRSDNIADAVHRTDARFGGIAKRFHRVKLPREDLRGSGPHMPDAKTEQQSRERLRA